MKKNRAYKFILYLLISGLATALSSFFFPLQLTAQDTSQTAGNIDSTHSAFVTRLQKIGTAEAARSILKFKTGRTAIRQGEIIEDIVRTTQQAKNYLKRGPDTAGINAALASIKSWYEMAGEGVFFNKESQQTTRHLAIVAKLLKELIYKTSVQKVKADTYYRDLLRFTDKIDSLNSDSILYHFPSDSAASMQYVQKIMGVVAIIGPADSLLKKSYATAQALQTRVNLLLNMLEQHNEEIAIYRKEVSDSIFQREFTGFSDTTHTAKSLGAMIRFSKTKEMMALWFYASDNGGKLFVLPVLIAIVAFFLVSLKEKIKRQGLLNADFQGQLIFRYPVLSAIMIVLNLFQFIFVDPPFVFYCWFWIISAACLTAIFRNYISRYWMMVWLSMLLLFVFACADNIILEASVTERWCMLVLATAGMLSGSWVLLNKVQMAALKEKAILYFIAFVVLLELASVITNIGGRYNLSKTFFTSGYFNIIVAILFLWTVRMINEALFHAAQVYKTPERKLFYINFDRVGNRVPAVFYIFLVIGWFVLFGRNFYSYRLIAEPLENFLYAERTVGDYSFTIKSLLVFIVILVLSMFASRVVSFFASDHRTDSLHHDKSPKAGLGSWLLLVRITIISMGLFLAFAAAGIPMDKIAIILGALSVGIGFGLQTLINNLVSGLIIAFEKPVNVGDIVEIAGKAGTMKSIGFRSSIITTWEGSNVIIPNGDLMNAHLVNWSAGQGLRRIDVTLGLAYGTDLKMAGAVLKDIFQSIDKILKYPEPTVQPSNFGTSAIDISISFWVKQFKDGSAAKSELIAAIDNAFKQKGISIPRPQQDVHLYNAVPEAAKEKETPRNS